jgi:hypothetical protein
MLLSQDLLIATQCGSGAAIAAKGRFVTARSVRDGTEVFSVQLPVTFEDPLPVWEFAGLFVIQDMPFLPPSGGVVLVSRDGHVRLNLAKYVVDGMRFGDDLVLLMGEEVSRLDSLGNPRWSFPSSGGGYGHTIGGQLVALPGGDLLEYTFTRFADSGVRLQRFDLKEGKVRWKASCEGCLTFSIYSLRESGARSRQAKSQQLGQQWDVC